MRNIIIYIARKLPINKTERRQNYPQLWYIWPNWLFPKHTRRRKLLELLCLILTRHEMSNTEWGYGGGNYIDRHCRWCDKLILVRKEEEIIPECMQPIVDNLEG